MLLMQLMRVEGADLTGSSCETSPIPTKANTPAANRLPPHTRAHTQTVLVGSFGTKARSWKAKYLITLYSAGILILF